MGSAVDELSPIVQAGKACADELSPIDQAGKICAHELSPILPPLKKRKHVAHGRGSFIISTYVIRQCTYSVCPKNDQETENEDA